MPRKDDRLTFGEIVAGSGVLQQASRATREVIKRSNDQAAESARVHLYVISCLDCAAPKTCCSYGTTAYLFEAIPLAARLIRERRDGPALRKQLREAADAMERTPASEYRRPCVFLNPAERCTVYEDRPRVCGTHMVSSPAEACSTPGGIIDKIVVPLQDTAPPAIAAIMAADLGLEPIGTHYCGVMPRMVLLCLEAWPRRDYARFLADGCRAAAAAYRDHA